MIKFNELKDTMIDFANKLENNIIKEFKSNVIPLLSAGLIAISTIGAPSLNATDFSLSLKSGSERVSNPDDLGMYLALDSLKKFDETFLRDNKVTPEHIYKMAKINLITENAYTDKSPRFALKSYNLQKELLKDIESIKNTNQDLLTKVYTLSMGSILLDPNLNYEKKISLLEDKLDEFEDISENNTINLNSDKITSNQIENMKNKEVELVTNILHKNFVNPEIQHQQEQVKMFAKMFTINDGRLNILSDKDKAMMLSILEKNFNNLTIVDNEYRKENSGIAKKESNEIQEAQHPENYIQEAKNDLESMADLMALK